jgi:hypothetical protein
MSLYTEEAAKHNKYYRHFSFSYFLLYSFGALTKKHLGFSTKVRSYLLICWGNQSFCHYVNTVFILWCHWATKLVTPLRSINLAIGHNQNLVFYYRIDLLLFLVASGPHGRSRIHLLCCCIVALVLLDLEEQLNKASCGKESINNINKAYKSHHVKKDWGVLTCIHVKGPSLHRA